MEDYKSNSFTNRQRNRDQENSNQVQEKRVEKVVNGPVKIKKKSGMDSVKQDLNKVSQYAWYDVVIPSIKKVISDIVRNGIDLLLYGENAPRKSNGISASKTSYGKFYEEKRDYRDAERRSSRTLYDIDDVILPSRGEAEMVLDRLDELIESYGQATVADLYDLLDITNNNYCNNNYGWTNLVSARVMATRDGYLLKLPRAIAIN